MNYKYLFGPVQSRRLGISLGVDCILAKTCNLDCVYCECGATTNLTIDRREYVPASAIIGELTAFLSAQPQVDFVTFGGSGEPTLNSGIGAIIRFLKKEFPAYKTALLTNGTLLYLQEVREAIMPFDFVLPSLDAVSARCFKAVNRPHKDLDPEKIIQGLLAFAQCYSGVLWVEVFIVPSVNDTPEELSLFKEVLSRICPARVQLNSLDRPGTCKNVKPASAERLREIADFLLPLPVEIISRNAPSAPASTMAPATEDAVLSTVRRRPLTLEEIAVASGMSINDARFLTDRLSRDGRITSTVVNNRLFFKSV